jgi:hypothetical protein
MVYSLGGLTAGAEKEFGENFEIRGFWDANSHSALRFRARLFEADGGKGVLVWGEMQ